MRSYVEERHGEKRREFWIWTAVAEGAKGRRWGRFEVGDRSGDRVAYGLLPRGRPRGGQGGEVNRNGGTHSRLRDRLNRLRRSAKGYSKSVEMLRDSIALVYLKLGLI